MTLGPRLQDQYVSPGFEYTPTREKVEQPVVCISLGPQAVRERLLQSQPGRVLPD